MIVNRDKIIDAAIALLSVCDGAKEIDGQGFNKPDSERVRRLLSYESLSDAQVIDISERLVKYHNQLENFEFNTSELKPIIEKSEVKEGTKIRLDSKGEHETVFHESWNKFKISFGQNKGKSLGEILLENPSYISWLAREAFYDDVKEAAQNILAGKPIDIPEPFITLDKTDKIIIKSSIDYKDRIKELSDKSWNGENSYWTSPLRIFDEVIEKFPEAKILPEFQKFIDSKKKLHSMSRMTESDEKFELDNFGHGEKKLYPYQHAGLHFLETANGRAIISDVTGLGKTPETIAFLQLHKEERPALIVCPSTIKGMWKEQMESWLDTDDTYEILNGKKPHDLSASIAIINYDILNPWQDVLKEYGFKTIIFDEAHRLRNPKTIRTKAAFNIVQNILYRIPLTGTPLVNRPKELYSLLYIVAPEIYNFDGYNQFKFLQRYCDGKNDGYGWSFNGAENTEELADKLKYLMIRRTKEEVGLELPPKTRTPFFVELTNKKKTQTAHSAFQNWLENTKYPEIKAQNEKIINNTLNEIATLKGELLLNSNPDTKGKIERLKREINELSNETYSFSVEEIAEIELEKQMVMEGKYKPTIEWITDFLESGEKLVVFAWHKKMIKKLMDKFGNIAVKVDGSVKDLKRTEAVKQFQTNPDIKLFIGNIQAAGEGITLTAASNVLFTELPWTPSALIQCEARIHRIGAKYPANYWYMLSKDTVEEYIMDKIEGKHKIINEIMDERDKLDFKFYEQT